MGDFTHVGSLDLVATFIRSKSYIKPLLLNAFFYSTAVGLIFATSLSAVIMVSSKIFY